MSTRIYVGGLPQDIRQSEILDIFRNYAPQRVDLKAGYGFLEFRDTRDADDAVHDMDGFKVDGRRLIVQAAKGTRRSREDFTSIRDRRVSSGGYKVDVIGIDARTSWQDLKDFARQAGNVVYADVIIRDGKKQGIIEYATLDDMENALRKLDDTKVCGCMVRVSEHKGDRDGGRDGGRDRERSPRRDRSYSPRRERSPPRNRSRSPDRRSRSRSPRRSRSRSPMRRHSPSPRRSDDRKSSEKNSELDSRPVS